MSASAFQFQESCYVANKFFRSHIEKKIDFMLLVCIKRFSISFITDKTCKTLNVLHHDFFNRLIRKYQKYLPLYSFNYNRYCIIIILKQSKLLVVVNKRNTAYSASFRITFWFSGDFFHYRDEKLLTDYVIIKTTDK